MMVKEATTPQTKHAGRMVLPGSSQKYSWAYLRICGSQETDHWKSPISLSSFLLLFFFYLSHVNSWLA